MLPAFFATTPSFSPSHSSWQLQPEMRVLEACARMHIPAWQCPSSDVQLQDLASDEKLTSGGESDEDVLFTDWEFPGANASAPTPGPLMGPLSPTVVSRASLEAANAAFNATLEAIASDPPRPRGSARWCALLTMTVNIGVKLTNFTNATNKIGERMSGQQHDPTERRTMYLDSLRRWLANSSLPVIVAENSGEAFDELRTMPRRNQKPVELVRLARAATCADSEIGCHEASAVARAVSFSRLLQRKTSAHGHLCTHVLMVAGRYFLPNVSEVLAERCGASASLAVQTPEWMVPMNDSRWRQETSAYGFDKRWAPYARANRPAGAADALLSLLC